jgi:hypothetical protein
VLHDIHRWHWVAMGGQLGLPDVGEMLESLPATVLAAIDRVAQRLPGDFPEPLFDGVAKGIRQAARRLAGEPDRRAP